MRLAVTSRTPEHSEGRPPIVLIHGAWHAAWCWEGNFLDYFARDGWQVHALSLRGHGGSEGRRRLRRWSIADYVEDVAQVVSALARLPILIGHSMGGFVAQKYVERHAAAGVVLLASVPPSGTLRLNLRMIRRHPLAWLAANLTMRPYRIVKNPRHARHWFFPPGMSREALIEHHSRLQDESYRAALDMLVLDLPRPGLVKTPVAVLGGENDRMFPVPEIERTARAYGVAPRLFPAAHNMMSDPHWESVAAWIAEWAASLAGAGHPARDEVRGRR